MTDVFVTEKACDQPLHGIALGDSETLVDEKLEVLHDLVYKTKKGRGIKYKMLLRYILF